MKTRKPWLAFLLSLLCPGLGQLYNGNLVWAFAALVVGCVLAVVSSFYLFDTLSLLIQAIFLSLAFDLFFAIHAHWEAKKKEAVELKPYQRWWIYLGFAILLYGLPDGYGYLIPQRFRSFQIPSESMVPNLLVGDRLVADGWAYRNKEPRRGDIIVFDYPRDPSIKYVKRLIGLPGDVVQLRNGELYVNNTLVPQRRSEMPSLNEKGWNFVEYIEQQDDRAYRIFRAQPTNLTEFGPVTVPPDHYFAMGDNRDRSSDSRVWGFVSRDQLIGRMVYIYFSWDSETSSLRKERLGLQVN